ncbi:uncharacterized protein PHACADRAFT_188149 [Phanerochaete carnosa HHB-10118-sp]|uniref:Uncharacterized protein n=1 Tax=Phanerochaete carnosa (strain HHB-10118-sp) TaxID=650164 RepID=K5VVJ6_PHACS|nr:uncharacterized protein PHACADRAFT_188149 [Phanerochaete carnosa HHB-10118-sp]EKM50604.1 hypothetical protein PHACADRAFT_188149 [Phanerochaete carnosa HHB-10118-sp]
MASRWYRHYFEYHPWSAIRHRATFTDSGKRKVLCKKCLDKHIDVVLLHEERRVCLDGSAFLRSREAVAADGQPRKLDNAQARSTTSAISNRVGQVSPAGSDKNLRESLSEIVEQSARHLCEILSWHHGGTTLLRVPSWSAIRHRATFTDSGKRKVLCKKCLDKHIDVVLLHEERRVCLDGSAFLRSREAVAADATLAAWNLPRSEIGWMEHRACNCLKHLRDCELQTAEVRQRAGEEHNERHLEPRRARLDKNLRESLSEIVEQSARVPSPVPREQPSTPWSGDRFPVFPYSARAWLEPQARPQTTPWNVVARMPLSYGSEQALPGLQIQQPILSWDNDGFPTPYATIFPPPPMQASWGSQARVLTETPARPLVAGPNGIMSNQLRLPWVSREPENLYQKYLQELGIAGTHEAAQWSLPLHDAIPVPLSGGTDDWMLNLTTASSSLCWPPVDNTMHAGGIEGAPHATQAVDGNGGTWLENTSSLMHSAALDI